MITKKEYDLLEQIERKNPDEKTLYEFQAEYALKSKSKRIVKKKCEGFGCGKFFVCEKLWHRLCPDCVKRTNEAVSQEEEP